MSRLDIDPDTWVVLNRLLDEALDLPAAERAGWVDTLAPEYETLKPQLRDLLTRVGDETATILRARPAWEGESPGGADAAGADLGRGDLIGPYRLVRELAHGGMGVVWLAERADGLVQRPVALKLPRGAWERPALAERMAREREILASLNHPNIARLYDAGITAAGLPFLALEYVEGRRIDEYCREHALNVRQKLTLFSDVVRAVAHAHARLVIHRDLKPANILVTADGQVRLLDFGIARILDAGRGTASELTQMSGRVLTPDYAAPEQIAGAAIGTASDIYSLGVILFELLVGARPYRLERRSVALLEEAILRVEAPRPSSVAADAAVCKALRGDLDTIILKTLKKDPDERYATVAALAEDLARHQQGFPVLAQPDRAAYRLSKFVRRNRLAVGAVAAVFLALIIGTAVAWWQARVALVEKQRAEEVKQFIASIFADANPYAAAGGKPTLLDVLTRARERIDHELAGRPRLRVEMLNLVGQSLISLGEIGLAESTVDQARVEAKQHLAADDPHRLHAHLLATKVQRFRGRTDEMRAELADLIPQLRRSRTAFPEDLVDALTQRMHLAIDAGDFVQARVAAGEAHELSREKLGPRHARTAATAAGLAMTYVYERKTEDALPAAQRAFDLCSELYGPAHPLTIDARGILARALALAGQQAGAVEQMTRVTADAKEAFGASSMVVGFKMQNLAMEQLAWGEIRAALESAEEGVRILTAHSDEQSFTTASAYGARGRALLAARRTTEALPDLTRTAEILVAVVGPNHDRTLHARAVRAVARGWAGEQEQAEAELDELMSLAASDPARRRIHHALGIVARLAGKPDEARRHQEAALSLLGVESTDAARERMVILTELGLARIERGNAAAAEKNLREALAFFADEQGTLTPAWADALVGLGRALLAQDHADEARQPLLQADEFWSDFDSHNRGAGEAAGWLGLCLHARQEPAAAESACRRARSILENSPLPIDRSLLARLPRQ